MDGVKLVKIPIVAPTEVGNHIYMIVALNLFDLGLDDWKNFVIEVQS